MHGSILNLGRRHGRSTAASPSPTATPGLSPATSHPGSIHGPLSPAMSPAAHPHPVDHSPVRLGFRLESGPVIMYGSPEASTGSIISGVLDLEVIDNVPIKIREASMSIVQEVRFVSTSLVNAMPRGFKRTKREIIAKWNVLEHLHEYAGRATYGYPFSHLLPGSLPPTSTTGFFTIAYYLDAAVVPEDSYKGPYSTRLDISVGRSVVHITDKTSVRVFPPTDLTASIEIPTAVFPNSTLPAEFRIEGLVVAPPADSTVQASVKRWRPKRFNWRFDELLTVKPPVPEDAPPDTPEPAAFEHKQTLAMGQLKQGWKIDYTHKGLVQLVTSDFVSGGLKKANKDVVDPVLGITLSHELAVEVIIAEEVLDSAGLASPELAQPVLTGNARVLRSQFRVAVTDRPGLGISWDDEVPPVYADVPLSPPTYDRVSNLPSLEEVSNMVFSPALSPAIAPAPSPTLRHMDPTIQGPESSTAVHMLERLRKKWTPLKDGGVSDLRPSQSAPPQ